MPTSCLRGANMVDPREPREVEIDYTNHAGERRKRRIRVMSLVWGKKDPWHPDPCWLLFARDMDREATNGGKPVTRWFAMHNVHSWRDL